MEYKKRTIIENNNLGIKFLLNKILGCESSFFWMTAIYALAISFLSLAAPLSVQFLINSVSFTAMMRPIVILAVILLIFLIFWAALNAIQFFVTEVFQDRFFARMASEITILLLKSKEENPEKKNVINRFFETMVIQKTIPKFLTKTLSSMLQAVMGLTLISFYHPIFFLFSLAIVGILSIIWFAFYKKAIISSFNKSTTKYQIVDCFEEIEENKIKSEDGIKEKINSLIGRYSQQRKRRFKNLFFQVISLLTLYVIASVSLLLIGGSLILKKQLTIGQLVAAELILSAILLNFALLGRDLEHFYDLVASCEKLSRFYKFPFINKDFDLFTNFKKIKTPNPLKVLPKIIGIFFAVISIMLIITPWQQTSQGFGYIIAIDPNDRAQNINAPIDGRIKKWYVNDGSIVKKGDKLVEIVDNDPLILQRIRAERNAKKRKFEVTEIASETSKINYKRQKELYNKGLSSQKDVEEAKIRYKKLLASKETAQSDFAEAETKLSRQANQIIYAPKNGAILKVLAGDNATLVKANDQLATFAPNLNDPAIEIYVSSNDIPLVTLGRKVRIQFEGWPIVQFSGWPSIAIGTFGGIISAVDPSVSSNGKLRVIVKRAPGEDWPDERFLRHGAKAKAWILLNRVSLGYEFWRQINKFPPSFDNQLKATATINEK